MPRQTAIRGRTAAEISATLQRAIRRGDFQQGDLLPPVRALAAQLGVNRNTVATAYKHLSGVGLIEGHGRGGSVVTAAARSSVHDKEALRNLAAGNPDVALLPDLRQNFANLKWRQRLYEDVPEDSELIVCAESLFKRDKIPTQSVWLANGAFDAIARILAIFSEKGDAIAVEDPCVMTSLGLLRAMERRPVAMQVDDEGVSPEALDNALIAGAKVVILTPRAQNPFGGSWSPQRCAMLADVLTAHKDLIIIEDDHFSALSNSPALSLAGVGDHKWAVIRSVSKYLGPDLRLAFVSSEASIRKKALSLANFSCRWTSGLLQAFVLNALNSSAVLKDIRRAGGIYEERRSNLLKILRDLGIVAYGRDGLNVWIPVQDEAFVARRLLEMGWLIRPGSIFRLQSQQAIRVTVSALSEETAAEFAEQLAVVLGEVQIERGA